MTAPRPWTPGRWTWWTSNSWRRLRSEDGPKTRDVLQPINQRDGHIDISVTEEDMALIASAPDLYEALVAILARYVDTANSGDCGFWNPEEEPVVIAARAALSKARGEQP